MVYVVGADARAKLSKATDPKRTTTSARVKNAKNVKGTAFTDAMVAEALGENDQIPDTPRSDDGLDLTGKPMSDNAKKIEARFAAQRRAKKPTKGKKSSVTGKRAPKTLEDFDKDFKDIDKDRHDENVARDGVSVVNGVAQLEVGDWVKSPEGVGKVASVEGPNATVKIIYATTPASDGKEVAYPHEVLGFVYRPKGKKAKAEEPEKPKKKASIPKKEKKARTLADFKTDFPDTNMLAHDANAKRDGVLEVDGRTQYKVGDWVHTGEGVSKLTEVTDSGGGYQLFTARVLYPESPAVEGAEFSGDNEILGFVYRSTGAKKAEPKKNPMGKGKAAEPAEPAAKKPVADMDRNEYASWLAKPENKKARNAGYTGQGGYYIQLILRGEFRGLPRNGAPDATSEQKTQFTKSVEAIARKLNIPRQIADEWMQVNIGERAKNPDGSRSKLYVTLADPLADWTAEKMEQFRAELVANGYRGSFKTRGGGHSAKAQITNFDSVVAHGNSDADVDIARAAAEKVWGNATFDYGLDDKSPSTGEYTSHTDLLATALVDAVAYKRDVVLPRSRFEGPKAATKKKAEPKKASIPKKEKKAEPSLAEPKAALKKAERQQKDRKRLLTSPEELAKVAKSKGIFPKKYASDLRRRASAAEKKIAELKAEVKAAPKKAKSQVDEPGLEEYEQDKLEADTLNREEIDARVKELNAATGPLMSAVNSAKKGAERDEARKAFQANVAERGALAKERVAIGKVAKVAKPVASAGDPKQVARDVAERKAQKKKMEDAGLKTVGPINDAAKIAHLQALDALGGELTEAETEEEPARVLGDGASPLLEGITSDDARGVHDSNLREKARMKALIREMGLADSEENLRWLIGIILEHKDVLATAASSDKEFKKYMEGPSYSKLRPASEQRFKEKLVERGVKEGMDGRDLLNSVYNYAVNVRVPKVFSAYMRAADGTAVENVRVVESSDSIERLERLVRASITLHTDDLPAFERLTKIYNNFRKSDDIRSAEFISMVLGMDEDTLVQLEGWDPGASDHAVRAMWARAVDPSDASDETMLAKQKRINDAQSAHDALVREKSVVTAGLATDADAKKKKEMDKRSWVLQGKIDKARQAVTDARMPYTQPKYDLKSGETSEYGKSFVDGLAGMVSGYIKKFADKPGEVTEANVANLRGDLIEAVLTTNLAKSGNPASSINQYIRLAAHGESDRPYFYTSPEQKSIFNLREVNHLLRTFDQMKEDDPEFDYMFLAGGFADTYSRYDDKNLSETDVLKIQHHLYNNPDKDGYYWMWTGQYADKTSLIFVRQKKLDKAGLKADATAAMYDNNTTTLYSQYRDYYDAQEIAFDKAAEAARKRDKTISPLTDFMMPGTETRADRIGYNPVDQHEEAMPRFLGELEDPFDILFAMQKALLDREIHGDYIHYAKNGFLGDLVKRAGSILTGGQAANGKVLLARAPEFTPVVDAKGRELKPTDAGYADGKEQFRAMIIEDLQMLPDIAELIAEFEKDGSMPDATDGVAFLIDEYAPHWADGLGGVWSQKEKYPEMLTAKAILSGTTEDYERSLQKFNFVTLSKSLAEMDPNSAYAKLYDFVSEYNKNHATEKVGALFMSSAAKMTASVDAVKLFKNDGKTTDTLGDPRELARKLDRKKHVTNYNVEDLLMVLDARHEAKPHDSFEPLQKTPDLMEWWNALKLNQQIQLRRMESAVEALRNQKHIHGFDMKAILENFAHHPGVANIMSGDEVIDATTESMVLPQMVTALEKITRNVVNLIHPIEIPAAVGRDALKTSHLVPHKGGEKVKLSAFNMNTPEGQYRYTEESKAYATKEAAVAAIVADAGYHMDMIEANDDFINASALSRSTDSKSIIRWDNRAVWKNNVKEWEIVQGTNKAGETGWLIPGELGFYHRVPGDNPHSHTMGRLNRRIPTGRKNGKSTYEGNFIQTSLEDQILAGADFDVDTRYVELATKRQVKGRWVPETGTDATGESATETLVNTALLIMADAAEDPAHLARSKAGINLNAVDDAVARNKEGMYIAPGNTFSANLFARKTNVMWPKGLGQVAVGSHGISQGIMHGMTISNDFEIKFKSRQKVDRTLVVGLNGNQAARRKQFLGNFREMFGNWINLFADHSKILKINFAGIDDRSAQLAGALLLANGELETQEQISEYLNDTIADYLMSDQVQEFFDLRSARETLGAPWQSDEDILAGMAERQIKAGATPVGRPSAYATDTNMSIPDSINTMDTIRLYQLTKLAEDFGRLSTGFRSMFGLSQSGGGGGSIVRRFINFRKALKTLESNGLNLIRVPDGVLDRSPFFQTAMKQLEYMEDVVFTPDNALIMIPAVEDYIEDLATAWSESHDGRPVPASMLVKWEQRAKQAVTSNAIYNGIAPDDRKDLTVEALGNKLKSSIQAWRLAFGDNPFLNLLQEDKEKNLAVKDSYRVAILSEDRLDQIRKSFDALPDLLKHQFALYAATTWGPGNSMRRGSFWKLLGTDFSKRRNALLVEEQKRWHSKDYLTDHKNLIKLFESTAKHPSYWVHRFHGEHAPIEAGADTPFAGMSDEEGAVYASLKAAPPTTKTKTAVPRVGERRTPAKDTDAKAEVSGALDESDEDGVSALGYALGDIRNPDTPLEDNPELLAELAKLDAKKKNKGGGHTTSAVDIGVELETDKFVDGAVKLLKATGFVLPPDEDFSIENLDVMYQVSSKVIKGEKTSKVFARQAAEAMSYLLAPALGIPERNHKARTAVQGALYQKMTTGKVPTQLDAGVWQKIVEVLTAIYRVMTGAEYKKLSARVEDVIGAIENGDPVLTFRPKKGTVASTFQALADNNPMVGTILVALTEGVAAKDRPILTGSMAYADQVTIYRHPDKPMHDVDLLFDDRDQMEQARQALDKIGSLTPFYSFTTKSGAYTEALIFTPKNLKVVDVRKAFKATPFNKGRGYQQRSYRVVDEGGKEVGSYRNQMTKDGLVDIFDGDGGLSIDFMMEGSKVDRTPVAQPVTVNGKTYHVPVSSYVDGFIAKLRFFREKDLVDYALAERKSAISGDFTTSAVEYDNIFDQKVADMKAGKPVSLYHMTRIPFRGERFSKHLSRLFGFTKDLGEVFYTSPLRKSRQWAGYAKTGTKQLPNSMLKRRADDEGGTYPVKTHMALSEAKRLGYLSTSAKKDGIRVYLVEGGLALADRMGKQMTEKRPDLKPGDDGYRHAQGNMRRDEDRRGFFVQTPALGTEKPYQPVIVALDPNVPGLHKTLDKVQEVTVRANVKNPFIFGETKITGAEVSAAAAKLGATLTEKQAAELARQAMSSDSGYLSLGEMGSGLALADRALFGDTGRDTGLFFEALGFDALVDRSDNQVGLLENTDYYIMGKDPDIADPVHSFTTSAVDIGGELATAETGRRVHASLAGVTLAKLRLFAKDMQKTPTEKGMAGKRQSLDLPRWMSKQQHAEYRRPPLPSGPDKPYGMWYGFEGSWLSWQEGAFANRGSHTQHVQFSSRARILRLSSESDIRTFDTKYGKDRLDGDTGPVRYIDWASVKRDYDGMEMVPYVGQLRQDKQFEWVQAWGVESGVFWNLDVVEELPRVSVNYEQRVTEQVGDSDEEVEVLLSFTTSAVEVGNYFTPSRVNSMVDAMRYRFPKKSAADSREYIGHMQDRLSDPNRPDYRKRFIVQSFRDEYATKPNIRLFNDMKQWFEETLSHEAQAVHEMAREGVDVEEYRTPAQRAEHFVQGDMFTDTAEFTTSMVAWDDLLKQGHRAFDRDKAMQRILIDENRHRKQSIVLVSDDIRRWKKTVRTRIAGKHGFKVTSDMAARAKVRLFKKAPLTPNALEDLVFSALGTALDTIEEAGANFEALLAEGSVFNNNQLILNKKGKPLIEKDKKGHWRRTYDILWKDKESGVMMGDIGGISALEVADIYGKDEFRKMFVEMRARMGTMRDEANVLVGDMFEADNERTTWIRDLPEYIMHQYRKSGRVNKPKVGEIRERVREQLREDWTTSQPKKNTAEENDVAWDAYMKTAEFKEAFLALEGTLAASLKEAFEEQEMERLREDGGRSASEEASQAGHREYTTYEEAAVVGGLIPVTLNAADLIGKWQNSVSEVARNKRYFTLAALSTDALGRSVFIPLRGDPQIQYDEDHKEVRKELKDVSVNRDNGFRVLENLIRFASSVAARDPDKTVVFNRTSINRTQSPWDQIRQVLNDFPGGGTDGAANLRAQGFEFIPTPGFNMEGVWVAEGAPAGLLKHITSRGADDIKTPLLRGVVKGILWFNNFTKSLAISVSAFHHVALYESYIATYGLNVKDNPLTAWGKDVKGPARFMPFGAGRIWNKYKQMSDPKNGLVHQWVGDGLVVDMGSIDVRHNSLDNFIAGAAKVASRSIVGRPLAPVLNTLLRAKQLNDNFLWNVVHPAIKLEVAEHVYEAMKDDPVTMGITDKEIREDVARYVNDAFGGQEWEQYVWANPFARAMAELLFFAPDWTISALNASGLPELVAKVTGTPNPLAKRNASTLAERQKLTKYWPAFGALVLFGVPSVVQALIYEAFGDPDEGDERWVQNNEKGRKAYVDITPIIRAMGLRYGSTNHRRTYLRWGKQAWEVGGWITDPRHTAFGKTSMAVKTVLEQMIGKNSAFWEMPWEKSDTAGIFQVNGRFTDSRSYALLTKFVPMSVQAMIVDRPTSFFAPVKLGHSKHEAVVAMAKLIYSYADNKAAENVRKKPRVRAAYESMSQDILDAAELNGYSRKTVFAEAVRKARSRLYQETFAELSRKGGPRDEKINYLADAMQRMDTAKNSFKTSMTTRFDNANISLNRQDRRYITKKWNERRRGARDKRKQVDGRLRPQG